MVRNGKAMKNKLGTLKWYPLKFLLSNRKQKRKKMKHKIRQRKIKRNRKDHKKIRKRVNKKRKNLQQNR